MFRICKDGMQIELFLNNLISSGRIGPIANTFVLVLIEWN